MASFVCRFVRTSTGRENIRRISARSEDDAKARLAAMPDVGDILWVERMDEPAATERQLAYLARLGVQPAEAVTIREASDLIDNALRKRVPGDARDQELAAHFGLEATRFASKQAIFAMITEGLSDDRDLARWYLFRVARHLGYAHGQRDRHPGDRDIVEAAALFLLDEKAMRSVRRAARQHVCGFRWFGSFRGDDGVHHMGESAETLAFRKAVLLLKGNGGDVTKAVHLQRSGQKQAPAPRPADSAIGQPKGNGAAYAFIAGLAILTVIFIVMIA